MNRDRISEEALGDSAISWLFDQSLSPDLQLITPTFDLFAPNIHIDGACDYESLAQSMEFPVEANELDKYLGSFQTQPIQSERDDHRALRIVTPIKPEKIVRKVKENVRPIPLSQSVGVGPQIPKMSHQIELVNPLEEFYRPRYKSDYFTQDGKVRKPRYVKDRHDNHFITLKVPVGIFGKIRVDWLTIQTETGDRYSMPYQFQVDNDSPNVRDQNPIYVDIEQNNNGTMKLFLVLIKSKQDELKLNSSLKPFRPVYDAFEVKTNKVLNNNLSINPKQLIQKYQLEKSQLAFTLCSIGIDNTIIHEWDTTVYSTVITEMAADSVKRRKITCPNCSHAFFCSSGPNVDDNEQETNQNQQVIDQFNIQPPLTKRKLIRND